MRVPGFVGLFYLGWVCGVLTFAALRSRRRMRATPADAPLPVSRSQIFVSTALMLGFLLFLSIVTGRTFGFGVFDVPRLGAKECAAGVAALAFQLVMMLGNRALRSAEERRAMTVYRLVPRTRAEWSLFTVVAILAGVAEEAAYRGVLWALLAWCLGSSWLAAAACVVFFALAHAMQGWKSGITIAIMAASMHVLVAVTDTLVVAMAVHAIYDLIAGIVGSWRLRTGQVEG